LRKNTPALACPTNLGTLAFDRQVFFGRDVVFGTARSSTLEIPALAALWAVHTALATATPIEK
jgi:hypothetical protein